MANKLLSWVKYFLFSLHVITPYVEIKQRFDLIQIPKPIKSKALKQERDLDLVIKKYNEVKV
jgi:hypothetical protein